MPRSEHIARWEVVLDGLSDEQCQSIFRPVRRRALGPHRLLFRQGDPSESLFVVERGAARVFHVTPSGEQFTIGICGSGGVLGAVAAVLGRPHLLSAESIESLVVAELPRKAMLRLMERIPRLAMNMNQLLARMAMESFVRSSRMIDSAPLKLGKVLRDVAAREDDLGGAYAVRGLTHQDLATMVGASRTWVTLMLRSLERKGILTRKKGAVIIPDLRRLEAFIAGIEKISDPA